MSLVLRRDKGAELTHNEMDDNFAGLAAEIAALQAMGRSRILSLNTTQVGNVGAGFDILMSNQIPEGVLSLGSHLRVTSWGYTENNANAKSLSQTVKTGVISQTALPISQTNFWKIVTDFAIKQEATTNYSYYSRLITSTTSGSGTLLHVAGSSQGSMTLANPCDVYCVGVGVANNDVVQNGMLVELLMP